MSESADPLLSASEPIVSGDLEAFRLRRQWVISKGTDPPQPRWPSVRLNDRYRLWYHRQTRLLQVDVHGVRFIVLGVALVEGGRGSLREQLRQVAAPGGDVASRITALLERISGTYVLLYATSEEITLYTDPAGMLTVFRGGGRVASSPTLLGELRRDATLDEEFPFTVEDDWYPGDLTPFVGVSTVMANHALAIEADKTWRFWPLSESPRLETSEAVERIASILKRNVAAAIAQGEALFSLTGGKDSRVALAASRDFREEAAFFTLQHDGVKPCDPDIGSQLARVGALDHRVLQCPTPDAWLTDLYDEMTAGLSIGARRDVIGAVNQLAGPDRIHINGLLGEVAQGIYWPSRRPSSFSHRTILSSFAHRPDVLRRAFERWLATVPDLAPTTIYNLVLQEQRVGRHSSVGETASMLFFDSVTPWCSREVFELVSASPTARQFDGSLPKLLVQEMWPELQSVPYCRPRRRWKERTPRRVKVAVKSISSRLSPQG